MKKTGLASFSQNQKKSLEPIENPDRVRRGKGDVVAITVRLPKGEWRRLRDFAAERGETLQTLAISGFSHVMMAAGQAPLDV